MVPPTVQATLPEGRLFVLKTRSNCMSLSSLLSFANENTVSISSFQGSPIEFEVSRGIPQNLP